MNMLFTIILILIDTIAMLNVVLIVEVLFGASMETNIRKYAVASVIYIIIETALELILGHEYEVPVAFAEYGMMAVIAFIFANKKRIKAALLTFPAVFVYLQWFYMTRLVEMLFGLDKYRAIIAGVEVTPAYFVSEISLISLLVYLRYVLNKKNYKVSMTLPEIIIINIYCIFSPILITIFETLESVFNYGAYNLMWVLFVLVMNVAVIYAIYHRKKARYYRELSSTYKQQFNEEYQYFKDYKDNNKDMMRFRHDWNNHMIVMQDLFEQGKFEEAKQYFDSFPNVKKQKYKKIVSGNETVDTLLAAKENKFAQYQIEMAFSGSLVRIKDMEPVDICILFSNLIDNAIEELIKVEGERYFHIVVHESPAMIMISFKNSTTGNFLMEGEQMITTKSDSSNHGIGLQNVKDIVAKYHGEYSFEVSGNEFVSKVILPFVA